MTHYICPGSCHGESDHPQNCETESCELLGQPLVPCTCDDGKHEEARGTEEE